MEMGVEHTCNKISNQPLQIVARDPMNEREETEEVLAQFVAVG